MPEGIIDYRLSLSCDHCETLYAIDVRLTILVLKAVNCPKCGSQEWLTLKGIKAAVQQDDSTRAIIDSTVYQYDNLYVDQLNASQNLNSDAPTAIKLLSELWLNALSQQALSCDGASSPKVNESHD